MAALDQGAPGATHARLCSHRWQVGARNAVSLCSKTWDTGWQRLPACARPRVRRVIPARAPRGGEALQREEVSRYCPPGPGGLGGKCLGLAEFPPLYLQPSK